jgi:uncharacterized protein (DUF983 family)
MDEHTPQEPSVAQPLQRPPQIYCPRCKGGNPSNSILCMWCGLALDQPPLPDRPPSRNLLSAYKLVVSRPSAESFASEVAGASWPRTWIAMLTVTIVNLLVLVASVLISKAMFGNLPTSATGGAESGATTSVPWTFVSVPVIFDFVVGPAVLVGSGVAIIVSFFLNTLLTYWLCRRFGGIGRTGRFGPDFKVHAYLLSLVSAPLSLATSLASLVPYLGSFGGLAFSLYGFLLQYYAIRASMQMARNNARIVIAVQFAISFVLSFIIIIVSLFYILSVVFGSDFLDTFSTLQPTSP